MKKIINVQNLKCDGCVSTIKNSLKKIDGVSDILVNPDKKLVEVEIENDNLMKIIISKLTSAGYPPSGEDNPFLTKTKSYVSCAIGRVKGD